MAYKLNKDWGNELIANPKSNLTRFANDGDRYSLDPVKLRSTRFGATYNNYGFADDTTKPQGKKRGS